MSRKLFKFFLIPLQLAMAVVLIAAGAFLWRLHRGPINIDKLIPYITQIASTSDTGADFSVGTAELRWGGSGHLVDFYITDFKFFDDRKKMIASIPLLSFSFSPTALLQGTIAPRTLVIYRPHLDLTLNKSGELIQNVKSEDDSSTDLEPFLQILEREKHLVELSLSKAKIKITNAMNNAVWNIPEADLIYSRRRDEVRLNSYFKIALDGKNFQTVTLKGFWKESEDENSITIATEKLNLMRLPAVKKYPLLKDISTPISLKIDAQFRSIPPGTPSLSHLRRAIERINFSVTGDKGTIALPAPVKAHYDLKRFTINGSVHRNADGFDLPRIDLVMQNEATVQANMSVSGIGTAIDSGSWEKIRAALNAKAQRLPVAMLASYWPASLGPDIHDWVKRNLNGGMIDSAGFELHFKGNPREAGIEIDTVDGMVDVTGTQIFYLEGMPPVDDLSGQLRLTQNDLTVTIKTASSHNVTVQSGGTFSILGMSGKVTTAALDINVQGKIPDILDILDAPPLGFMSAIGIDPRKTTGTGQGNLQLKFPLGSAFKSADQMDVTVDAEVRNADVEDIIMGLGLQDAILNVTMGDRELSLSGTALFYGATAKYTLNQFFDTTKDVMTDIRLHTELNDRARERLNYPFSTAPALSGLTPTDVNLLLKNDGTGVLKIDTDLTGAEIDLREIGWTKPAKTGGKGSFMLKMANGKPTSAPLISLTDDQGASVKGELRFAKGVLKKVDISSIKTPRTDATASVDFSGENEITVKLNAKELDISGLLKKGTSFNARETDDKPEQGDPYRLTLDASVDRLWLSEKGYSEKNKFTAHYHDGWKDINVDSIIGENKVPSHFSLKPAKEEGSYTFLMTSGDAGHTLKTMDYTSTVKGGKLEMNGTYTVGQGSQGTLNISNFYLENSQVLIRILQMTSFSGILDTLRGDGLLFDKAEIPFTIDQESMAIDSALVSGSSLGITLNGKYFLKTKYMNLYGSIIPFYSVNSFLGKIPLIGGLFAGEKGGGLIAPTYTVKGKLPSPDISVNALSALTPGVLRSVVGKIVRDEGDLSEKEEQTPPPAEKKEEFKPIDPSVQTEIKDEELHHETPKERVLEP